MFPDAAGKPTFSAALSHRSEYDTVSSLRGAFAQDPPGCVRVKRGLRLNMANNPKKVKDPTEVALSAIQEALNISDAPAADRDQPSVRVDAASPKSSTPPAFEDSAFAPRAGGDPPTFEPLEEPRFTRRPAND